MTPTKDTKTVLCPDCPNVLEKRVEDAAFRATVLLKLESYDNGIERLGKAIQNIDVTLQKNFSIIYFRIGVISGTIGLITGAVSALVAMQFVY